jgi:hypothetical protein
VEELLELGVARKKRLLADHLCKDATDAPHVDRRGVVSATEENLGRPVPKCHDLHIGNEKGEELEAEELCYPPLDALRAKITVTSWV